MGRESQALGLTAQNTGSWPVLRVITDYPILPFPPKKRKKGVSTLELSQCSKMQKELRPREGQTPASTEDPSSVMSTEWNGRCTGSPFVVTLSGHPSLLSPLWVGECLLCLPCSLSSSKKKLSFLVSF